MATAALSMSRTWASKVLNTYSRKAALSTKAAPETPLPPTTTRGVPGEAGLLGRATLELGRADLARGGEHAGIGVEPETPLLPVGRTRPDLGRKDHAVVGKGRLRPRRRAGTCRRPRAQTRLRDTAPARGHCDVTDPVVDAAGDAAHHDGGDVEAIEHELRGHGRIHHADAAQEQHDIAARRVPAHELHAVGIVALGIAEAGLQGFPFRLEGADHSDARHGVEPIGRPQRQSEKRQQQAQDGSDEAHGVR